MISIAINGFGRIGKNFLLTVLHDSVATKKIAIKAINIGNSDPEALAYAIQHDTLLGTYRESVSYARGVLTIGPHAITIITEVDAARINWKSLGIDWVVEATGKYTTRERAQQHLDAGAQRILITAPAHDADVTIIPGVNSTAYQPSTHRIVSLGSCTTNAVVPLLHVIDQNWQIRDATMTTVHAYTNSQELLDVDATHKDVRRSRAAALNIIPATTGASETVIKVLPNLAQKFSGISLRVPVPVVSLIDLVCTTNQKPVLETVHHAFRTAAAGSLKNILAVSDEPLVSSDYHKNPYSVTLDTTLSILNGSQLRIFGWYDNEWGYSTRLKDFLCSVADQ